jgi:hypothetical protein
LTPTKYGFPINLQMLLGQTSPSSLLVAVFVSHGALIKSVFVFSIKSQLSQFYRIIVPYGYWSFEPKRREKKYDRFNVKSLCSQLKRSNPLPKILCSSSQNPLDRFNSYRTCRLPLLSKARERNFPLMFGLLHNHPLPRNSINTRTESNLHACLCLYSTLVLQLKNPSLKKFRSYSSYLFLGRVHPNLPNRLVR